MIFVTLGSQKFQFDRLLQKLDELVERGVITEEITAQIGAVPTFRSIMNMYGLWTGSSLRLLWTGVISW